MLSLSPATDPARAALAVILAALVVRLALGLAVDLGTDETYTVAVSRTLSWSYFDHPPLHQWITHVSATLFGEGRLARLPFILLFAGTGWLIFRLTAHLFEAQAGFWAVVALNLAAFFTLSAGSWIVPDGVLLFFLALAANAAARALFPPEEEAPAPWRDWLTVGLALGLAGLSKYHAAFVGLGLAGFLLGSATGRRALGHPAPYVAAVAAAIIVSPVIFWNAANGWVSFLFQAGRSQGDGFAPWLAGVSLLAQAGWLLPWVFAWAVLGVMAGWRMRDPRAAFLLALGLPTIVLFTLTPMFGNLGLPHWAMPGWFLLMPLAGVHLARRFAADGAPAVWARRAALGSLAVLALAVVQAATGVLARLHPAVSRNDPTLELFGWGELPARLKAAGLDPVAEGRFLIADGWLTAGRMDVAFGADATVMPASSDPRHFAFLVDQRRLIGQDALVIVRARREAQVRGWLAGHFGALGPATPITLGRGGMAEIPLVAFPARGFAKPVAWPYGVSP
jgi:4-amino-4-deoxy-L-arabinose transferase-like glycosyltransferase